MLVRQYLYAAVLSDAQSGVRSALLDGVPAWQARIGGLAWPVTRKLMIAGMDARAALLPRLEQEVAAELDWFDGHLSERRYLVGDRFGRADITAASLLAPLARPAEYPASRQIVLPPSVEDALARWSARPSIQWVRRTYAEDRGWTAPPVRL